MKYMTMIPLLLLAACGERPPATAGDSDKLFSAFQMSQTFCKKRLKSPATADFPFSTRSDSGLWSRYDSVGKIYQVRGYVDSQNSFGGLIRTWYQCELTNDPTSDMWELKNFKTIER